MPKRTANISIYLKKFTKPELLKLAKKKKAKIPKSWTKTKIVETLSTIVKKNDLPKLDSRKSKTNPKIKPIRKIIKRTKLEDRVLKIFQHTGLANIKNKIVKSTIAASAESALDDVLTFVEKSDALQIRYGIYDTIETGNDLFSNMKLAGDPFFVKLESPPIRSSKLKWVSPCLIRNRFLTVSVTRKSLIRS